MPRAKSKTPAQPKVPKPLVKRPAFDAKREKWKQEVFARLQMNVALDDPYTKASYPEPMSLDMNEPASRTDFIKDRLNAGALIALERRLKRLSMVIPGSKEAEKLESDILDRAGFTRKPQTNLVSTGPVLFINGEATANSMRSVYEKQKTLVNGTSSVVPQTAFAVIEQGSEDEPGKPDPRSGPQDDDADDLGSARD